MTSTRRPSSGLACSISKPPGDSRGGSERWRRTTATTTATSPRPPPTAESFVYRSDRPFHPGRFDAWLDDWDGDVVRLKGFAWVASRPDTVLGVSQAGPAVQAGPIGEWGDDDPATRLVVIGRHLDTAAITAALDGCLTDESAEVPSADADPFPREA